MPHEIGELETEQTVRNQSSRRRGTKWVSSIHKSVGRCWTLRKICVKESSAIAPFIA